MNCVLLKMGGNGVRFGSNIPKQFYEINGVPLFAYVLSKYVLVSNIDKFILVTNGEWIDITKRYSEEILGDKLLGIVCGGDTNAKSTYNGIMFAANVLKQDDILLVHDVTDPIISIRAINDVIAAAEEEGCAGVITEQVHTLYQRDENDYIIGTIEKRSVGSGYSPEAIKMSVAKSCFERAKEAELCRATSALALIQSMGIKAKVIVSHQVDLKITYKEDMNSLLLMIENGERLYKE